MRAKRAYDVTTTNIKSDIGLKLAESENQAKILHPQLYTVNSLSFVSPPFIFHPP